MFEEIDFDSWFSTTLLDLFRVESTPHAASRWHSILQQHVMWMIGEWIDVKFSKANRVQLYSLVSAILAANGTDLVLKLTACKTLRIALDDFDFEVNNFASFVTGVFPSLCGLLVEVEECDTKMMVLNLISLTIQRYFHERESVFYLYNTIFVCISNYVVDGLLIPPPPGIQSTVTPTPWKFH